MSTQAVKKRDDLGEGVVFETHDYKGYGTRLLIVLIDLFVILASAIVIGIMAAILLPPSETLGHIVIWSWLTFSYLYLTVLESHWGTLGFLVTNSRIVNLKGDCPSVFRMTFRLLLWVFGPFDAVIDLLWLGGDANRQTLRDKLAGTYVVKKAASPIGRGRIHLSQYHLFGMTVLFPEVRVYKP